MSAPQDINRVERLERRLAAENSRWRVHFDHIRDQQGNEVLDYLVISPKAKSGQMVSGVVVLPLLADGRIALIRTFRVATQAFCWEAARGFIDPGDTGEQAALRELAEETGLTCELKNLEFCGCITPEASTLEAKAALYLAWDCTGLEQPVQDREAGMDGVQLFEPDGLQELMARFEIEEPGTLLLLMKAGIGLGR